MEYYRAVKMSFMYHYQCISKTVEGKKQIIEACVPYDIIYTKCNHMQDNAFIHICVIKL